MIVANTDVREVDCPLVQTSHFGAVLKVESFKIIVERFAKRESFSDESNSAGENVLAKHYLVFSLRHAAVLGNIPRVETLGISRNQRNEKVSKQAEIPENSSERCFVFLLKFKEHMGLNLEDSNPSFTSCIQGYFLAELKQADGEESASIRLEAFRKSVIIRFEKDCSTLAFLHPGCLYYVIERCHVGKTMRIQKAIDIKGMCPVIDMSSNLRFEQVDRRLLSHDVHGEWMKLSEKSFRVSSVRESLSMQNQPEKNDFNG